MSRNNKLVDNDELLFPHFLFRIIYFGNTLALSWRRSLSYRNQSIDLLCKSMEWFLYDRDLRYEVVKGYDF